MRLSVKIMIIICGIFLATVAVFHVMTTRFILDSFIGLERKNIRTDLKRAMNALGKDLEGLESNGGDWGAWDETRDFIKEQKKEYIADNLNLSTIANLNLNFIIFFDKAGDPVYSFGVESGDEVKEAVVSGDLIAYLKSHKLIFNHKNAKDAKTGIILMPEDAAIITAWPISNSEMNGPVSGTLVMGRYLGDNELKSLEERTQLKVALQRVDDKNQMPDDFNAARADLSKGSEIAVNNDLTDVISGYGFLKDIYGNNSLILKVSAPRDIYKYGKTSTAYFRWANLIAGSIIFIVLFFTLRSFVIRPILRLKGHVLSVGKTGDLSARINLHNRDEIGALAGEFDRMLAQLSDARNRLMEQSYYSGIGEMAADILHNIRNILTPMVGQIASIREKIREVPFKNIEQAVAELGADNLDPGREKSLKRYLCLAVPQLMKTCQDINHSLMTLYRQTVHIEEALSQQNKFASFERALEPLKMDRILKDAIGVMPQNLRDAVQIDMETGLADLPPVSAERVVLVQVITNLLINASESILRKGLQKGNIWIKGFSESKGEIKKVHVIISDDGEGIDKEVQNKIFNRGFSTKSPKPSGLGLHWCGNVLSAMNGSLYVESEGAGHGSSFHILMPEFRS